MQIASNAITGLKKLTTAHMFLSVLEETPGCCSSTKLAELSNPEMPSIAAEKPRKSAVIKLPDLQEDAN